MASFDQLSPKDPNGPASGPGNPESERPAAAGGVLARLKQAREALELKNLTGAMAIYEEVLASAGARPDVLVTISGDLGVTGHPGEIIQLISPHYDAQRHGPATGVNLLQAYLAVRDPESAQHVLDLLFALNRPELEQRLFGFSNAIADLMLLHDEGGPAVPGAAGDGPPKIDLVSISRPIWYYGLEEIAGLLPPKEGRFRRVAFGQLALPGRPDLAEAMKQPEDELGRLCRGLPLWFAETLYFSPNYLPVAAVGQMGREHYVNFGQEWAPDNIQQLVESNEHGFDYVFTGTVRQTHADFELLLRLWEVKKFRERKTFTARWTPATADQALAQVNEQLRLFMEFAAYPAGQGIGYTPPVKLRDYIEALGGGLTLFLGEKQVLAPAQVVIPLEVFGRAEAAAAGSEIGSLLALSLRGRSRRLGLDAPGGPLVLANSPVVARAPAPPGAVVATLP